MRYNSLFFWDFYLFEVIFLIVQNRGVFRILPLISFETVKIKRKKKQKRMISGQFFSLSYFLNFLKFRDIFWCWTNVFDKLSILSEWRYLFVKILTHFKTGLKHVVSIPQDQRCCLTCIYSWIKFYSQKVRGSWVIGASKIQILRDKSMVLFGKSL